MVYQSGKYGRAKRISRKTQPRKRTERTRKPITSKGRNYKRRDRDTPITSTGKNFRRRGTATTLPAGDKSKAQGARTLPVRIGYSRKITSRPLHERKRKPRGRTTKKTSRRSLRDRLLDAINASKKKRKQKPKKAKKRLLSRKVQR